MLYSLEQSTQITEQDKTLIIEELLTNVCNTSVFRIFSVFIPQKSDLDLHGQFIYKFMFQSTEVWLGLTFHANMELLKCGFVIQCAWLDYLEVVNLCIPNLFS